MTQAMVLKDVYCNRCGDKNPRGSRFCESCGDPFDSSLCACGAELVPRARFCHMCGVAVSTSAATLTSAESDGPPTLETPPLPEEEPPPPSGAQAQVQEVCDNLLALHHTLLDVHHKAADALSEEKKHRASFEEAHSQAQVFREKAMEAMRAGDAAGAKEALDQQLIYEHAAAEARAHLDLARAACEPLRDQLFALHNQFLESVDLSLGPFAQAQAWAAAEELFRDLLGREVSNSRRARVLFAMGIVARDGLGDIERAREAFRQAAEMDARLTRAKEALESLG